VKRKSPITDEDLKQTWVCEGCGAANTGVNPPDACDICGHEFFENLWDVIAECKKEEQLH
jgi:rubrerythrin